jgi:hypothetical protein
VASAPNQQQNNEGLTEVPGVGIEREREPRQEIEDNEHRNMSDETNPE